MLKYVEGDAVKAVMTGETTHLLQITNCMGSMGSGIAFQIKSQIPDAYKAYKQLERDRGLKLGDVSYCHVRNGMGCVFNLNGQYEYGRNKRQLNYGALAQCLNHLDAYLDTGDTIAVPYLMGCDRAGGDWEVVSEMLEFLLKDFEVVVYKLP